MLLVCTLQERKHQGRWFITKRNKKVKSNDVHGLKVTKQASHNTSIIKAATQTQTITRNDKNSQAGYATWVIQCKLWAPWSCFTNEAPVKIVAGFETRSSITYFHEKRGAGWLRLCRPLGYLMNIKPLLPNKCVFTDVYCKLFFLGHR